MTDFEGRNPFARLGDLPRRTEPAFAASNLDQRDLAKIGKNKTSLTELEQAIGKPFSTAEMFDAFDSEPGAFAKHLPLLYNLAIGVSAKVMVDIGIGLTTRALLKAAEETGGRLYSCDHDRKRYAPLLDLYPKTKRWRLSLTKSDAFIASLPDGLDLVSHDAETVMADLEALLPKVKQFGIITLHDTQHVTLGKGMIGVVTALAERFPITAVTLPYGCGLTIIRVEQSEHGAITPAGLMKKDRMVTLPFPLL